MLRKGISIKVHKLLLLLVNILFVSILSCINTYAKNNVENIEIDVAIHKNGSATITQNWKGRFDEGTELYLPIDDKSIVVKNFKVKKGLREYLEADRWDVDWSFETKKWRSGINYTEKGVELCFGISEYGDNIYTFSYDIDPLVKSYIDADGFNFRFVNPDMETYPSNVSLRIRIDDKKLSTENARIWGFGFDGIATFSEDGYGVAFSTTPLTESNYVNVTLETFKGILSPNVRIDDSFENAVLNTALENSDYGKELSNSIDNRLILVIPIIILILGLIIRLKGTSKKEYF